MVVWRMYYTLSHDNGIPAYAPSTAITPAGSGNYTSYYPAHSACILCVDSGSI
jgi:hypothetical protein